ncbi:MAG: PHP domain-containing protein [Hamadaea sp.]|uniref:PHP domain-containing protein n=1 Tax=Hamadaea sp. TaxID=2024425 RepID=UPI001793B926|nr:PHP domain-containing protein [Hamadaea sp.]NUT18646.1 PHP domain-containing protein [Hamadaea sp.]
MGLGHHHHDHAHGHSHDFAVTGSDLPAALDLSVPDSELSPSDTSRRTFLRGAGLLGAGAAVGGLVGAPAFAEGGDRVETSAAAYNQHEGAAGDLVWLAGDHHIHTQHSSDAQYRVIDHVKHAHAYGLGWMVITDHGSVAHAKIGVEKVNPDIRAARDQVDDILVFQGLEWNIPAAEHGTVFVHPGRNEVAVLKEFENAFDGVVTNTTGSTSANEALAIAGLNFLNDAVTKKRVQDAMFFANHPARKGIDSPHEIRGWRDAAPRVALGFEGAPGHQAAGIAAPLGPGSGRGYYDNSPSSASFPGYPLESYRTWGGFDWMTSTVGGLWDSLLAEGKPWWITANSDSHSVYGDTVVNGGGDFAANGRYDDPVYKGPAILTNGDFWPGYYSRTHVGATRPSYAAVMAGLRAGRVWVDHGGLIDGIDVRVGTATLGGTYAVRTGHDVQVKIKIKLASGSNWAQFVPKLARVDLIAGEITGPAADKDVFSTPKTKVVKSFDVSSSTGTVTLTYTFPDVEKPFYLRLRGTDGKRTAVGLNGATVDPVGPAMDVVGAADPWQDLWFYTNPIFVLPLGR